MQTIMWQKKRIITILTISVLFYILLRNKKYEYSDERVMSDVKAESVWEFIADFSNAKKVLIPHMQSFSIDAESGNYDHWKYSVSYSEPLPVWPYLNSFGVGHYSVRAEGDRYIISSDHKACFFQGWICSSSSCVMTLRQISKDTHYKEDTVYECPPLLSSWCHHVADYTRQDYINNLLNYFKSHKI